MIQLNSKLIDSNISTVNSLFFNSLKIVVNIGFPFLLIPYISRILSVEQIGIYNWNLSIINYLIVLAGLSLPIIGIREIGLSKKNSQKIDTIINNIFVIKVITVSIAVLILIIISMVQKFENNQLILLLLGTIMIFEIFAHEWVYIAFGDHKSILFRSFLSKLLLLIFTFSLVNSESDFIIFIVIYIVTAILPFIISYKYLFIIFKPKIIKIQNITYLNLSTVKSFSISLLMAFYGKVDIIILGFILNSGELGIFSSAYKLVLLALVFITTWSMVLLPKSSLLHEEDDYRYIEFINKSLDLVLVVGLFVTITLIMYSKNIVLLIFGDKFYEAYYIINYLAPITVILSLYNVLIFQILYVKNNYLDIIRFFIFVYLIFIFLVSYFDLNIIYISLLILLMNVFQLFFTLKSVNRFYKITLLEKNKLKIYFVSIGILIFYLYFIGSELLTIISFFKSIVITSIGYFLFLLILKENIIYLMYKKTLRGIQND